MALVAIFFLKSEIGTAPRALGERFKDLLSLKTPVGEVKFAANEFKNTTGILKEEIPAIEPAAEPIEPAAESKATNVVPSTVVVTRTLRQQFSQDYSTLPKDLSFSQMVEIYQNDGQVYTRISGCI